MCLPCGFQDSQIENLYKIFQYSKSLNFNFSLTMKVSLDISYLICNNFLVSEALDFIIILAYVKSRGLFSKQKQIEQRSCGDDGGWPNRANKL